MKRLKDSYYSAYASGLRPEDLVQNVDLAVPLMRDQKNEGGCTAALIELTSLKRAIMHTYLPETIIVIDTKRTITKNLPFQSGSHSRRVADLARASGLADEQLDEKSILFRSLTKRPLDDAENSSPKKTKLEHLDRSEELSEVVPPETADNDTEFYEDFYSNNEALADDPNSSMDCQPDDSQSSNLPCLNRRILELQGLRKRQLSTSSSMSGDYKSPRLDSELPDVASKSGCDVGEFSEDPGLFSDNEMERSSQSSASKSGGKGWPISSASRLSVFMKDQNTISSLDSQAIVSGGHALLQHMQDNLLLTACDVTCQLTVPPWAQLPPACDVGMPLSKQQLDSYILPVDFVQQNEVLNKYSRGIIQPSLSVSELKQKWRSAGSSEDVLSLVSLLYKFIDSRGAMGATRADIRNWRDASGEGECMAVVQASLYHDLEVRDDPF